MKPKLVPIRGGLFFTTDEVKAVFTEKVSFELIALYCDVPPIKIGSLKEIYLKYRNELNLHSKLQELGLSKNEVEAIIIYQSAVISDVAIAIDAPVLSIFPIHSFDYIASIYGITPERTKFLKKLYKENDPNVLIEKLEHMNADFEELVTVTEYHLRVMAGLATPF